jgi:ATP-dependent exoDNAse (exonuclease V) beta subunit
LTNSVPDWQRFTILAKQTTTGKVIPSHVSRLFQIYKSSAGSGKTYTLVKEYLKIVLRDPSAVRNILAITFTNAAAAEMKGRIIGVLGNVSSLVLSDGIPRTESQEARNAVRLLQQINEEWMEEGLEPKEPADLVLHAGLVLKSILHNYSAFSVSTIDSFVHRIIRTFAFDLHIPMNFEVELDAGTLLRQAVDMLVSRAGADPGTTRLLISFIINQAEEEKDLRIENQIADLAKTLMDENGSIPLQKLKNVSLEDFLNISRLVKASVKSFESRARETASRAQALISNHQISREAFFQGGKGIAGYFERLAESPDHATIPVPNNYVQKTINENKWYSGKAGKEEKESIDAIRGGLEMAFLEINGNDMEAISDYRALLAVGKNLFPVAVLNEVEKLLEEIKTENVLLHISDFNKKIAAIIAEQPVPFIYERLGERYRHYMIDEFQDTSVLQWQNLIPLVENALAGGHMSLVVGDGKQAIYRFRNGDVEQFAMLPALSREIRALAREEWEQSLVAAHVNKNLDTNYRSRREIVAFNNRFFSFARHALGEPLRKVYDGVEQKHLEKKTGGFVEIGFVDESSSTYNDGTLEGVVDAIRRCREAGHPLGDITILCRAVREASLVSQKLLSEGIPVISSESLLLRQSDEVSFILSLLRLLDNPGDQVAALEALTFLQKTMMVSQPDTLEGGLQELGLSAKARDREGLHLHQPLESLLKRNGIPFTFSAFSHQNLYDICETIIRIFFSARIPPSPFVAFFSDAVFDFAVKNRLSVKDFLEWWEDKSEKYSLVVPEGVDAIRVMTIHKSKGLQFPVVICPFSHRDARLTKSGQWVELEPGMAGGLETTWISLVNKDLEGTRFEPWYTLEKEKSMLDLLNLVYVAFTRAADKLFVLTRTARNYNMNTTNGILHQFLKQEGHWQDDRLVYRFGELDPFPGRVAGGKMQESPFREIISNPWSRALRMRSHQEERKITIEGEDPLQRGSLLHRAMEGIFSEKDVEPVLDRMLNRGEIDLDQLGEWKEKIMRLISNPAVSPYFEEGLTTKPEAGLFDREGNFFRPDRVVLMDDHTMVIDYKTGRAYREHREQVSRYAGLLEQMGYPDVRMLILYLDRNEAVRV